MEFDQRKIWQNLKIQFILEFNNIKIQELFRAGRGEENEDSFIINVISKVKIARN